MTSPQRAGREITEEITQIYRRNVDTVYRVCYSFMKNKPEAEDMTQETFLRMISAGKTFDNPRHEKAWLIATASNLCRDALRKQYRYDEDLDNYPNLEGGTEPVDNPVLKAVLSLPGDYKTLVYMHYYEGYTVPEIAKALHCTQVTVRGRLFRARKQLKLMLGGDFE